MTDQSQIGVIGIGAMGMGVAQSLLRNGWRPYVRDINPAREAEARSAGAIVCTSAQELATHCDIVITLVVDDKQTDEALFGAMIIQGIQPGLQVMTQRPELFWGMIASMWVGNVLLVLLNLPLIGIGVRLLTVSYRLLYPAILLFCCIGVYSLNNSMVDVVLAAVFGLIGYVFIKLDCEPAPLLLAFVLGPMMEEELRRSVNTARGAWMVFFNRPLSLSLLIVAAILLLLIVAPNIRKKREEAFHE